MMVHVRPMDGGDIPFAIKLTDTEGWGYAAADFRRLMTLEPGGCVVALEGERPVGVTSLTSYGRVAWVGGVVVDPGLRGKGVGTALMEHVMDYAKAAGVESLRLNAYLHAVPFYTKLGFKREFENIRFLGKGRGMVYPGLAKPSSEALGPLAVFDAPYFGANRTKVLEAMLRDYGDGFLLASDGHLTLGYVIVGTSTQGVEVGPWVVDPRHPKVAEGLLLHALAIARGRPVSFSSPTANPIALTLAHAHGLEESFRTLRMYRGSRAHGGDPKGYFALGGLEKG